MDELNGKILIKKDNEDEGQWARGCHDNSELGV